MKKLWLVGIMVTCVTTHSMDFEDAAMAEQENKQTTAEIG